MRRYRSIDLAFKSDYNEMMEKKALYTDDNPGGIDSGEAEWDNYPDMSADCIGEIDQIEIKEGFTY